ncbi:hypothetical protein ACK8HX_02450 [Oryzobacter sp. R7]|uniref:hypothetical protein n=1 Tax=Oryzobacter faecalis TaxID=3388656 RepID=UPI00398CD323
MALISCSACSSDNDIHLDGATPDGARRLRCGDCGHQWSLSLVASRPASTRSPFAMAKGRFATSEMVSADRRQRVARLKKQYLKADTVPAPSPTRPWSDFRPILSREGLPVSAPEELRELATGTGVRGGSMMVFNRAWRHLGDDEAAARTRTSLAYLLHGPEDVPLEDRLTVLLDGELAGGMTGLSEVFYTKVLHIAHPERFLPILSYGAEGVGKRDLALTVFGLHLPKADLTAMRIGRLATWSNDLLLELAGPGFRDTHHVATFLGWAKDRVARTRVAAVR